MVQKLTYVVLREVGESTTVAVSQKLTGGPIAKTICRRPLWKASELTYIFTEHYQLLVRQVADMSMTMQSLFHPFRVAVLNSLVSFLLFLAQVVIMAGVGTLSFFAFSGRIAELRDDTQMTSARDPQK